MEDSASAFLVRSRALTAAVAAALALFSPAAAQQQPPPAARNTAFILGRVVDAATGRPVAAATVTLGTSRLVSDGEGRFLFRDLAKGRYPIRASAPGYLPGVYGQRRPDGSSHSLVVEEGQRVGDARIQLWKEARLSGTVTDEAGDPIGGIVVSLLKREADGRPDKSGAAFSPNDVARTDDRGRYEFTGLSPADYVVAVASRGVFLPASVLGADQTIRQSLSQSGYGGISSSPADIGPTIRVGDFLVQTSPNGMYGGTNQLLGNLPVTRVEDSARKLSAYATTFHPSAASWSEAAVITVTAAEVKSAVDVQLRPVPLVSVSGTLDGPNGPEANFPLHLIPTYAVSSRLEITHTVSTTITQPNGAFTFPAVAPGDYVVKAWRTPISRMSPIPGGSRWGKTSVAVGNTPVTGVVLSVRPGAQVRGQVVFDGALPVPAAPLIQMAISRCFDTGWYLADPYANSLSAQVTASGEFTTDRLPPGTYLPCLSNTLARSIGGWSFESATLNGRNLTTSPLTLEAIDVSGFVLRFTNRPVRLSGTVRNARGVVEPQAAVIVLPVDVSEWVRSGMNRSAAHVVDVSDDGVYDIADLLPGEYLVVAVNDDLRSRWAAPATIQSLAAAATRLTVLRGEDKRQDLVMR